MGVARYYSFGLFLETRKVDETFKKYNDGGGYIQYATLMMSLIILRVHIQLLLIDGVGIILKISVVDLSTGEVGPAKSMRGEKGWTVGELKQHIEEVGYLFMVYSSFHSSLPSCLFLILSIS